jgi:tetratricopeptide (TPR) repeat protein
MPTPDAGSAADTSTELDAGKAAVESEPEPELEPEPEPEPAVSESQRAAAEVKKVEGNAAFKAKRYKQAIGFYGEAAQLDPTCAVYFCNRSTCYANLGDWNGASRAPTGPWLVQPLPEFPAAQHRCTTPRKRFRSTRAT